MPSRTLYSDSIVQLATNGSMLTTLQPGSYTLKFAPPDSLTQDSLGSLVAVQLAINSVSSVNTDISQLPPVTCTTSSYDNVVTSATGYYRIELPYASVDYSTLSSTNLVVQIPFTLDRYSLVYAQVGADFLLNEMDIRIFGNDILLHGIIWRNLNEIHQELPSGSYYLTISQNQMLSAATVPSHCGYYSMLLDIEDANGVTSTCSVTNTLPSQLNSGSSSYGGPISSEGTLHFYEDTVRVPEQDANYISFSLSQNSFVSVVAANIPSSLTSGIDFSITGNNGTIIPGLSDHSPSQVSHHVIFPITSSLFFYTLAINYLGKSSNFGCASFLLQIDIAPQNQLQNQFTCQGNPAPLPSSFDLSSGGVTGSIASSFNGWAQVSNQRYTIPFVTTKNTEITISFSYNPMVNTFALTLMRTYSSSSSLITLGTLKPQKAQGNTPMSLYLATTVAPGTYSIEISHPNMPAPFANANEICVPFLLTYNIGTYSVIVSSVNPPSLASVDPTANITLNIVFSDRNLYYAPGKILVTANSSYVAGSFYLAGSNGANISCYSATATTSSNQQWTVSFFMRFC